MTADEAARAGNQYFFIFPVHFFNLPVFADGFALTRLRLLTISFRSFSVYSVFSVRDILFVSPDLLSPARKASLELTEFTEKLSLCARRETLWYSDIISPIN
jgi:hypothetical protein